MTNKVSMSGSDVSNMDDAIKSRQRWTTLLETIWDYASPIVVMVAVFGFAYWANWWNMRASTQYIADSWGSLLVLFILPCCLFGVVSHRYRFYRQGFFFEVAYLIAVWDGFSFNMYVWLFHVRETAPSVPYLVEGLWLLSCAGSALVLVIHATQDSESVNALRIALGLCGIALFFGVAGLILGCGISLGVRRIVSVLLFVELAIACLCLLQGIMLRPRCAGVLLALCGRFWGMHLQRVQFGKSETTDSMYLGVLGKDGSFPDIKVEDPRLNKWDASVREELHRYVKQRKPQIIGRITSDALGIGFLFLIAREVMTKDADWIFDLAGRFQRLTEFLHVSTGEIIVTLLMLLLICATMCNFYAFYLNSLRRVDRYFKLHPSDGEGSLENSSSDSDGINPV